MDLALGKYTAFKYEECINILEEEMAKNTKKSLLENLVMQNGLAVSRALMVIAENKNIISRKETEIYLYNTYQNTVAPGLPDAIIPIELEMTAFFNFLWWNFFLHNNGPRDSSCNEYLPIIQRSLKRVVGISVKATNYVNIIEDILYDIKSVGKNLESKNYCCASLISELTVLIVLYILKVDSSMNVVEQCVESLRVVIKHMEFLISGLKAVKGFKNKSPLYKHLFKFGFFKLNSTVSDTNTYFIDCLYIIRSICFFILKRYEKSLLTLRDDLKSSLKPLWCYLSGLSAFMLNKFDESQGFVIISTVLNLEGDLKSRFNILHGQLLSSKKEYKEALKCFGEAIKASPGMAAAYYYMAEAYGKMGFNEEMDECIMHLVRVTKEEKFTKMVECNFDFETCILEFLHPSDEVAYSEACYAAAVTYGLIEKYHASAQMFEKYIELWPYRNHLTGDRIITTPNIVTILHEAATVNIRIGNYFSSERLLTQASNDYGCVEVKSQVTKVQSVMKDIRYINNLIDEELGIKASKTVEKPDSLNLFSEDLLYFFEEDTIGMMLKAEMESVTDPEAQRITLGKLIPIFSKHLAKMQKKNLEEEEAACLTLVKALSGKIFLKIAQFQIKKKVSTMEIERTFKRALACNQGDADVLCEYSRFLLKEKKVRDAEKLWKTFHKKEPALTVDQCQSLALRYLLRTNVTQSELEKLELDLQPSLMEMDF